LNALAPQAFSLNETLARFPSKMLAKVLEKPAVLFIYEPSRVEL
jgi:hypothetical protein